MIDYWKKHLILGQKAIVKGANGQKHLCVVNDVCGKSFYVRLYVRYEAGQRLYALYDPINVYLIPVVPFRAGCVERASDGKTFDLEDL